MNSFFRRRSGQRGTTVLLVATMLPLVLIPIVGLAIDGTILYIVQAKLSMAADGAALGAGRLLGTSANTEEIAGEFLTANFPADFWGSRNLQKHITFTQAASSRTVTINATVDTPLFFMRIFGHDHSTVAASAVATRTVSRIELVLDRSASMVPNISDLQTAASGFVRKFTSGVDQMGLVIYGGSAFIAWPPTKSLSSTGPTVTFADTPAKGQDNMLTMISAMKPGSYTATAEALYLAWQELKRADSILQDPSRPNYIVLFTDGMPNGITAYFNDPAVILADRPLKPGSCKTTSPANNPSSSAATDMKAWMGSDNPTAMFPPGSTTSGIYLPITKETSNTAKWWAANINGGPTGNSSASFKDQLKLPSAAIANCAHLNNSDLGDLRKIPAIDLYGNATYSPDYTISAIYQRHHVGYDANKPGDGYQLGLASWAATYNMAHTILDDSSMKITIYVIGYTGNGGVDTTLMKRIANTQDCGDYHSNWRTGRYIPAANSTQLNNAFSDVAGEVLRLAR